MPRLPASGALHPHPHPQSVLRLMYSGRPQAGLTARGITASRPCGRSSGLAGLEQVLKRIVQTAQDDLAVSAAEGHNLRSRVEACFGKQP
ncbi:hypothetical protein [Nocardiopsis rhodophaea]|uniref:hypothetical protein n=1 Tax=Nocardiopsis rhodophaea TaxID=280238 RepID=UPI0031E1472E